MARTRKFGVLETLLFAGVFAASSIINGAARAEEFLREKYEIMVDNQKKEIVISADLTDNKLTVEITQETDKKYFESLSEEDAKKQYAQRITTQTLAEISSAGTNLAIVSSPETEIDTKKQTVWGLPDRKEVTAVPLNDNFQKKVLVGAVETGVVVGGHVGGVNGILTILGGKGLKFAKGAEEENARRDFEKFTKIGDVKVTKIENNLPREWKSSAIYKRTYSVDLTLEEGQPTSYLVMKAAISDEKGGVKSTPTIMRKISLEKELVKVGEVNSFKLDDNDFKTAVTKLTKNGEEREMVFMTYDLETGERKFITGEQLIRAKSSKEEKEKLYRDSDFFMAYDAKTGKGVSLEGVSCRYEVPSDSFEKTEEVPADFSNEKPHYIDEEEPPFIVETEQKNHFLLKFSPDGRELEYKRLSQPSEDKDGKEKE